MANAYVDHGKGAALGINYLFTNGSTTVTPASDPTGELAANNYIKSDYTGSDIQWYKATAVAAGAVTISPAFQQATTTSTTAKKNAGVGSLADAYAHHNQATTDAVRSPGDIVYIRANLTYTCNGINIDFDEDGTLASPITLLGCDSVTDPWGDASNVDPIIDFSSTAFTLIVNTDDYWILDNIDVRNSTHWTGNIYIISSHNIKIKKPGAGSGAKWIYLNLLGAGKCEITDGVISGYTNRAITCVCGLVGIKNTSVDNSGIALYGSGFVLENVLLGQSVANTTDINCRNGITTARRCKFSFAKVTINDISSIVYSEDHNQVVGDHKSKHWHGMIERETTIVRSGGANNSVKVTPGANNHTNFPWQVHEWSEEAVAASAQTRGVYIQVTGIDTTYPVKEQLWFEAESFSAASGTAKQINKSDAVLTANSTWVWFPVTFTPGQVGKVRYRVYLAMPTEGATQDVYYVDNQLRNAS